MTVTLYIRTVTLYHVIFAPRSLNSQLNNKRFQNSELSSRLCAERLEKPSDAKRKALGLGPSWKRWAQPSWNWSRALLRAVEKKK